MSQDAQPHTGLLDSAREITESLDVAIILVEPKSKKPYHKDWPNQATKDIDVVARWLTQYPGYNLGAIPGDRYIIIDIDPRNGGIMSARRISTDLPITRTHQTGGGVDLDTPGSHLWYVVPDSVKIPKQGGKVAAGIDWKTGPGSQVLIPGSVTDRPYRLTRGMAPVEIPAGLLARITAVAAGRPGRAEPGDRPRDHYGEAIEKGHRDQTLVEYAGELAARVMRDRLSEPEALELLRGRWAQAELDGRDDIPWEKVEERYHHFRSQDAAKDADPAVKTEEPLLADGYLATPIGNVSRWLDLARGRARWVDAWKQWIVYRNGRWITDPNGVLVQGIAKETVLEMRTIAAPLPKSEREALWGWANRSSGVSALEAMPKMARDELEVFLDYQDVDANPLLLNVANGTIDLGNRELLPHKASDLITMQAPVAYDKDAGCPEWERAVGTWLPDPEIAWYMQKALGSGLCGRNVEHLFICYGKGANGKSTCFDVIAMVLGIGQSGYYVPANPDLLVTMRNGQRPHTESKMALLGKRLAVTSETAENGVMNEAEIKALTGDDIIHGRKLYQAETQFRPTHTLFMHTNHKPRIHGIDEGIWRRVSLIPWETYIPDSERIPRPILMAGFEQEASGILNWLLDGYEGWVEEGFSNVPTAMQRAMDGYRENSDHIGRWMTEYGVEFTPQAFSTNQALTQAWALWCHENGITMIGFPRVRERLVELGGKGKVMRRDGRRQRGLEHISIQVTGRPSPEE